MKNKNQWLQYRKLGTQQERAWGAKRHRFECNFLRNAKWAENKIMGQAQFWICVRSPIPWCHHA